MGRVLAIVALVGLSMATGVAVASPVSPVRHPVQVAPTSPDPASVVVGKGDHLWKISARSLGPEASPDAVAPYWREVIDLNIPRLRSGDPDLIYPGEVVELPAVSELP
jgi:nucleoid-associated protein YgaU